MIISSSYRFVFIHIHKCGGTSLELALEPYLAWNDLLLGSSPLGEVMNDAYHARFRLHKHSTLDEVHKVLCKQHFDTYYKFAFVRDPISRICSLYNFLNCIIVDILDDKQISQKELIDELSWRAEEHPELKWYSTYCALTMSFDQFISNNDLIACDKAFQSQVSYLQVNDSISIDKVIKLEDIANEASDLKDRLGIDFDLPLANKSKLTLVNPSNLDSYSINRLKEIYRDDYSYFGY